MPDNLRISAPINSEHTLSVKNNKPAIPTEVIDPSRVAGKTSDNKANLSNQDINWDNGSVFRSFLNKLGTTQPLSQTLGKLILGSSMGNINASNMQATTEALAKLIMSVKMDGQGMLDNIMFQQKNKSSFNSSLFRLLKDATGEIESDETKQFLGRFVKAYDSYSSLSENMNSIFRQLKSILAGIPKSYKTEIQQAAEMLQFPKDKNGETTEKAFSDNQIDFNLHIMKEKVLPALSKYVSQLNDYGETREKISLLTHSLSILNSGSREEVNKRFEELMDYMRYEHNMPVAILKSANTMYHEIMSQEPNRENKLFDALISVLSKNSDKGISSMEQAMIQDTMQSLLLDYSVYMPFMHLFIPVSYNDKFMFSDIWVEKDGKNKNLSDEGRTVLLNFEIEKFGSFQCRMHIDGKNLKCNFFLPDAFAAKCEAVKNDIIQILSQSGFNILNVKCENASLDISREIMQFIGSGRDSVDVTI